MYLKVLIIGIDELFDLHFCDRGAHPHFLHFPAEYVIEQGAFADPGFSYDQYIGRLFIHESSHLTSVVSDALLIFRFFGIFEISAYTKLLMHFYLLHCK